MKGHICIALLILGKSSYCQLKDGLSASLGFRQNFIIEGKVYEGKDIESVGSLFGSNRFILNSNFAYFRRYNANKAFSINFDFVFFRRDYTTSTPPILTFYDNKIVDFAHQRSVGHQSLSPGFKHYWRLAGNSELNLNFYLGANFVIHLTDEYSISTNRRYVGYRSDGQPNLPDYVYSYKNTMFNESFNISACTGLSLFYNLENAVSLTFSFLYTRMLMPYYQEEISIKYFAEIHTDKHTNYGHFSTYNFGIIFPLTKQKTNP